MYISLVILGILITGILLSLKKKDETLESLDSSEHPLKIIYPLAANIYRGICKFQKQDLFGSPDQLREIYMDEKPEVSQKVQGCKCIASVIAVLGITCIICFAYDYSRENLIVGKNHLKRPASGEGELEYSLTLNNSLTRENDINVSVSERKLEGEELEKLKEDTAYYIDTHLLNSGEKPECVRGNINLITTIPKTSVKIKWSEENSWFVGVDGKLKNSELIDPVTVSLHAVLTYYEEEWEYKKELTIYPPLVTEEESFMEDLNIILEEKDRSTQTEEMFELPENVDGIELDWGEKEDNKVTLFLLLGIFSAGIILPAMKQDIKKKQKKRNEQMMRDYPDIISKFVMLITAGMTCRAAWGKICSDYIKTKDSRDGKTDGGKRRREKRKEVKKFAYEEMLISDKEMQLGIPEIKVYERFGNRCQVPVYNRFGTLLARNIKRGSAQIIEILESESKESIAERRENVRKKGEETGTKLLLQMFGMLILVIAIVVVPAFSSFNF